MSSLGARKVVRTYSRQRKHSLYDQEPPTKRRRVESTIEAAENGDADDADSSLPPRSSPPLHDTSILPSSSPKECSAIFSDEPLRSTPPSSPVSRKSSSPPPLSRRRLMFSSLKRRHQPKLPGREPLSERSGNALSPPKQPPRKTRLVQMQLDLVAEVSKTCRVCGMEYIPSHAEDAALHRKFHAMNIGGVDVSRALSAKLKQKQAWCGGDGSFIAVISRRDALALRNKASEVLRVVNSELGAVPISDEVLWSQTRNSINHAQGLGSGLKAQHLKKDVGGLSTSDRFKAYLYITGQKCVGACLAERIQEAFPVLGRDDASEPSGQRIADSHSSSISIDDASDTVILGISRIWTSSMRRNHGIATRLMDSARGHFLYGMSVEKANIAFSQPTESGGRLARKWFGREAGWHVYVD